MAGELIGYGWFYGDNAPGYGDPLLVGGQVELPSDGVVADDGGERVTLVGEFNAASYIVEVGGRRAYSGASGQGGVCTPNAAGDRLSFIVPGGLPLGPHDVVVIGDGHVTLEGALTVVRRNRRSLFYQLNRFASPLGAHPGRGPVEPHRDALLDLEPAGGRSPLYRPRRGYLDAIGETANDLGGLLLTRLTAELAVDAVVAEVETTHGYPATGRLIARGEVIAYTGVTVTSFTGLVRDGSAAQTLPRGEVLALYQPDPQLAHSDLDRARAMMLVGAAEGVFLDVLGANYGVPRYFGVTDTIYRRLIRVMAFQAGKGTRTALDEFFDVVLDKNRTGADGALDADGAKLTSAAAPFTTGLCDVRVRIAGADPLNTRICKVLDVPDASTLVLDRRGSPWWEPADLADEEDVSWEILPWDIFMSPWKPATAIIRLNLPQPDDAVGFTYLHFGEPQLADDDTHVTVDLPIRQVLGVWLATDPRRLGTNYATDNSFAGQVIMLSEPLPAPDSAVLVDYGSIEVPVAEPQAGLPGRAEANATAEIEEDVNERNTGNPVKFPAYIAERIGLIRALLDVLVIAGVEPELEVKLY